MRFHKDKELGGWKNGNFTITKIADDSWLLKDCNKVVGLFPLCVLAKNAAAKEMIRKCM